METETKNFDLEGAFARLDEINKKLADPKTSLKDALELYKEGVTLVSACREEFLSVEKEIKILDEV